MGRFNPRRAVRLLCTLLLCTPAVASAQTLTGRIIDNLEGTLLSGARIAVLPGAADTVLVRDEAPEGVFQIHMGQPGTYRLRVERVGYVPVTTDALTLGPRQVLALELRLDSDAIPLTPLVVLADRIEPLFMADVRRRQRLGFGRFILRSELDRWPAARLEEVLAGSGLPVSYVRFEDFGIEGRDSEPTPLVGARQTGPRQCYASVYVDARPVFRYDQLDDELTVETALLRMRDLFAFRAHDLEAVEIYRGAAQVPAEFAGSTSQCGVIALWTRGGYGSFSDLPELPSTPSARRIAAGGTVYHLTGRSAPRVGTGFEAAVQWPVAATIAIGAGVSRTTHRLSPDVTSSLVPPTAAPLYVHPPGERPLTLWVGGLESRVMLTRAAGVWPLLSVRAQAARRSFTLESTSQGVGTVPIASLGGGAGIALGAETVVRGRFAVQATAGHDQLWFRRYEELEHRTNPTAARWGGTSLRLVAGYAFAR